MRHVRTLLAMAWLASSCRTDLPPPSYPLVTAPDAPFRASPPPPMEVTLPPPLATSTVVLPNGLRIVVARRPRARVFVVRLIDRAAGSADTRSAPGLALLTATMMNDGLDSPVVMGSAAASWDATTFALSSAGDEWEQTLTETARIFDAHSLALDRFRRRLTDMTGARTSQRDRMSMAVEVALGRLFGPRSPYGRPIGGRYDDLQHITFDDVLAFWRERYVPSACTLFLVGDVDPDTVAQRATTVFEAISGPPAPAPHPEEGTPSSGSSRLAIIESPRRQQSDVAIVLYAPGLHSEDAAALHVLVNVLSGAFTSRLNLRVREEDNVSYGMHGRLQLGEQGGALLVTGTVERDAVGSTVSTTLTEIERLTREPITQEELAREQSRWREHAAARAETTESSATWMVAAREWDADADVARVQALTPAAVLSVAQRYLDASRAQIVITGDTSEIESQLRPLHLGPALRLRP